MGNEGTRGGRREGKVKMGNEGKRKRREEGKKA